VARLTRITGVNLAFDGTQHQNPIINRINLIKEFINKMKPLKALKGYLKNWDNFQLHILLTKEDDVIVARCLDFSVSSHGNETLLQKV